VENQDLRFRGSILNFFTLFTPAPLTTCEGKVTQLYSGFYFEQFVGMLWTLLQQELMVVMIHRPRRLRFPPEVLVE